MQGCYGAIILLPIIVLFWQENGLSLAQVFILQAVYAATIVLLEIPSGYLSDAWSRKKTLIIASIFCLLAVLLYSVSTRFLTFLLGEIAYGIGTSFFSGTTDAITYDTLLELHREKEARRILGNQFFYFFGLEAVGSVIGGLLAPLSIHLLGNLRLAAYATLIPFTGTVLLALTLTEPERHKIQETRHFQAMWDIGKTTMLHNALLRNIIFISSIISTAGLLLFWFIQEYQSQASLPLAWFGVVHAIFAGSGAIASKYSHTISEKIHDRSFLVSITVTTVLSILAISFVPISMWGLLAFFALRIVWSLKTPLVKDLMNRMTTSDVRATVLSIHSFIHRLFFITFAPFIGWAADMYSMRTAILLCGILTGISSLFVFFLMRKDWEKIPKWMIILRVLKSHKVF